LSSAARAEDDASKKLVDYYRRKANVPPSAPVEVKDMQASKIKGAKQGTLMVAGRAVTFIMSEDGHYAVFGEVEDLSVDPFKKTMEKIALKGAPGRGPKDAKVVIVEYSDFQCPFCSRAFTTMDTQVLKEYGDKVRFYHKQFPLSFHPWAEPAAVAVECGAQQSEDAYWKLYNFMFSNQKDITPQNIKDKSHEALQGTKVDTAKFDDCFDNKKTLDKVKADMAEGQTVGVNGTPAFFINGRMISGAQPFENFKSIIDDELARAK
jgi:protein-disulfide isomerase